jgi:hypothetical protein
MITNEQLISTLKSILKNCTDAYVGYMGNAYIKWYVIVNKKIEVIHLNHVRYSDLKTKKDLIQLLKDTNNEKFLKNE